MSSIGQQYDWQLRITVGGIGFTSPGCDTEAEAQGLKKMVEAIDGVSKAEVEHR